MQSPLVNRTPEQCAQQQLDAYNKRNIDAFASVYADDVELIALPSGEVFCKGIAELRARYADPFEQQPDLHCRRVSRIVCPPFVIDEEDVSGLRADSNVHAVATYECRNGKIMRAWFLREENP